MIPVPKSPDDNGSFFYNHSAHYALWAHPYVSLLFINALCVFETESFLKVEAMSYSLLFPMASNILDITKYFMKEWKWRKSRIRAQRQSENYSILYSVSYK